MLRRIVVVFGLAVLIEIMFQLSSFIADMPLLHDPTPGWITAGHANIYWYAQAVVASVASTAVALGALLSANILGRLPSQSRWNTALCIFSLAYLYSRFPGAWWPRMIEDFLLTVVRAGVLISFVGLLLNLRGAEDPRMSAPSPP